MKKICSILTTALIMIAVLSSCLRINDTEPDIMTVYFVGNTMSEVGEYFVDCGTWKSQQVEQVYDTSAAPSRIDTVLGEEAEIFYLYTTSVYGHERQTYQSADGSLKMSYDTETDRIVCMKNKNLVNKDLNEDRLSDEEYRNIALAFAGSMYPLLEKSDYKVHVDMPDENAEFAAVSIELNYAGYALNEWIELDLTLDGQVCFYVEKLTFPEGIPQEILSAIDGIDFDLCLSSVKHCILENASKHIGSKMEILDVSTYKDIQLRADGSFACIVYTTVSIDGQRRDATFAVPFLLPEISFENTSS